MLLLKPHQLTILTTSQCTARCAHCCMNSEPGRLERLTFEQMRETLDRLHAAHGLEVVIFAGGEPTLLGEHLLDAIAHAASLGILTRMVTNASWAVTPARARARLVELREAGLAELNVSADDFHLPFIPFERVENAWHASKGLGFLAVVVANCWGPNSVITPRYIMDRLGEELPLRFDEEGRQMELGKASADGTLYQLSNAYIQRLGRAFQMVGVPDLIYPTAQSEIDRPCPWAVRSAALSPKNHLVACCGIEAEDNEVLDFGDLTAHTPPQLVEKADDDVLVNAIALRGPMFLKRFIQARAPELPFRENYASVCEICEHIVRRPEAVAILREHSRELASEVLHVRAQLGDQ